MAEGFNLIPQVITVLKNAGEDILQEVAYDILQEAQARCPVRTGALQASGYWKTHTKSTYGQGFMEGALGSSILPEVEDPGPHDAYVAFAMNYAIFVELGTSKMAAQPYLIPALESVRIEFESGGMWSEMLAERLPHGE